MNKEQIYNYVMNTPGNTNPMILKGLLEDFGKQKLLKQYGYNEENSIPPGIFHPSEAYIHLFDDAPTIQQIIGGIYGGVAGPNSFVIDITPDIITEITDDIVQGYVIGSVIFVAMNDYISDDISIKSGFYVLESGVSGILNFLIYTP